MQHIFHTYFSPFRTFLLILVRKSVIIHLPDIK
nr:MAG TPA: hypothetical protein [Caudoviricetes sp.]